MFSGKLAAQAEQEALQSKDADRAARLYRHAVRRLILPDLRAALVFNSLLLMLRPLFARMNERFSVQIFRKHFAVIAGQSTYRAFLGWVLLRLPYFSWPASSLTGALGTGPDESALQLCGLQPSLAGAGADGTPEYHNHPAVVAIGRASRDAQQAILGVRFISLPASRSQTTARTDDKRHDQGGPLYVSAVTNTPPPRVNQLPPATTIPLRYARSSRARVGCSWLREYPMISQPPPANGGVLHALAIRDSDPLPCGPSVGSAKAPGHLKHTGRIHDRLYPEMRRPLRGIAALGDRVTGCVEIPNGPLEQLTLQCRQPLIIGLEAVGPVEPQVRSRS